MLEALAAGMPMIASAVGGIPEIFGPDSPALTRPDADEIAAAMAGAVADIAKYRAVMLGRADLEGRFSAAVMAKHIETAYFDALGTAQL